MFCLWQVRQKANRKDVVGFAFPYFLTFNFFFYSTVTDSRRAAVLLGSVWLFPTIGSKSAIPPAIGQKRKAVSHQLQHRAPTSTAVESLRGVRLARAKMEEKGGQRWQKNNLAWRSASQKKSLEFVANPNRPTSFFNRSDFDPIETANDDIILTQRRLFLICKHIEMHL